MEHRTWEGVLEKLDAGFGDVVRHIVLVKIPEPSGFPQPKSIHQICPGCEPPAMPEFHISGGDRSRFLRYQHLKNGRLVMGELALRD